MVSDKVSKLVIGREREIVGLSNPQPDGSVKVDNMKVVGAVTECGKFACLTSTRKFAWRARVQAIPGSRD